MDNNTVILPRDLCHLASDLSDVAIRIDRVSRDCYAAFETDADTVSLDVLRSAEQAQADLTTLIAELRGRVPWPRQLARMEMAVSGDDLDVLDRVGERR